MGGLERGLLEAQCGNGGVGLRTPWSCCARETASEEGAPACSPPPLTRHLPSQAWQKCEPQAGCVQGAFLITAVQSALAQFERLLPLSQNTEIPVDGLQCLLLREELAPSLGWGGVPILHFLPAARWLLGSETLSLPQPRGPLGQVLRLGGQQDDCCPRIKLLPLLGKQPRPPTSRPEHLQAPADAGNPQPPEHLS